jgi:putative FmdB family regulatory protein
MPFYEYECQACKYYTEVMQKISDAPLLKCPSCGKRSLKKLVSAPVFRLKGAGWYETDFKSDKENKRNLVGEKDEPKSDSKTDSKDVKPEAKGAKPTDKDTKPAEKDTREARPALAAAAGGSARGKKSVSVSRKAAKRPAPRTSAKRAAARRPRRGGR